MNAHEQRQSTAARGCRSKMLDTNTVSKRTNLPRTNSCAQSMPTVMMVMMLNYYYYYYYYDSPAIYDINPPDHRHR
jgi:hypothetical protein